MLTRTIENAQKKVEEQNYLIRKRVLEYDDVMNEQRRVVYKYRREILEGRDMSDVAHEELEDVIARPGRDVHARARSSRNGTSAGSRATPREIWPLGVDGRRPRPADLDREQLTEMLDRGRARRLRQREEEFGEELMRDLERQILLQIIDNRWREHLYEMDYMREGIHLRGFAQIDPLVAYKNEGYKMFQELMDSIWEEFARVIFHVEVKIEPNQAEQMFGAERRRRGGDVQYSGGTGRGAPSAMPRRAAGGVATAPAAAPASRRDAAGRQRRRRGQPGDRRQGRAREDRPQRPLLVRLGQEVQEVPRRLVAPRCSQRGVICGALGAAGSRAASAPPTVAISGRAYAFNHMDTFLAGATIRVREIPGLSATTDANGDYVARGPRRHQRHPVHRSAARLPPDRPADLPHPRRADRKRQLPDARRRRVQRARGAAHRCRSARTAARQQCAIVTTASARNVRGVDYATFRARTPHGVPGATAHAFPALAEPDLLQRERDPRPLADRRPRATAGSSGPRSRRAPTA